MSIMIIIIYPEQGEKLSWGTVDYEVMKYQSRVCFQIKWFENQVKLLPLLLNKMEPHLPKRQ